MKVTNYAENAMPTLIAPDFILDGEPLRIEDGKILPSLRDEASSHGVCCLRVLREVADGTLYQVEVAPTPELLIQKPVKAFLTCDQLHIAKSWDAEARQHANTSELQEDEPSARPAAPLTTLRPVFVTVERLERVYRAAQQETRQSVRHLSRYLAFLRTAFVTAWQRNQRALVKILRQILLRRSRLAPQVEVQAQAVYENREIVGYWLTIHVPASLAVPEALRS